MRGRRRPVNISAIDPRVDLGNCRIDGMVTFQVIRLGGDDRQRPGLDNSVEDAAHVFVVFLGGFL